MLCHVLWSQVEYKTVYFILWYTLQDGEIFGSVSYEHPAIFGLLEMEHSEAWMVLPQLAHDSQLCIVFWVNTFNYKWSPVFCSWWPSWWIDWQVGEKVTPKLFSFC